MNWLIICLAGLIPLIVGFIWYSPPLFAKAWMKVAGLTEEKMKGGNMIVIFGLTYVLSVLIAMLLLPMVIHQVHLYSILIDEPGFADPSSEVGTMLSTFMDKYGQNFRSFKHGALHGTIAGTLFVTPIIAINALFERRGFKYIAIHAGFWIISLLLMGGVLCQWN